MKCGYNEILFSCVGSDCRGFDLILYVWGYGLDRVGWRVCNISDRRRVIPVIWQGRVNNENFRFVVCRVWLVCDLCSGINRDFLGLVIVYFCGYGFRFC